MSLSFFPLKLIFKKTMKKSIVLLSLFSALSAHALPDKWPEKLYSINKFASPNDAPENEAELISVCKSVDSARQYSKSMRKHYQKEEIYVSPMGIPLWKVDFSDDVARHQKTIDDATEVLEELNCKDVIQNAK
jgi:hypothetical protein